MAENTKVLISLDGAAGKTLDVRGDIELLRELIAAFGTKPETPKRGHIAAAKPKQEPAHASA